MDHTVYFIHRELPVTASAVIAFRFSNCCNRNYAMRNKRLLIRVPGVKCFTFKNISCLCIMSIELHTECCRVNLPSLEEHLLG